MLFDEIHIASKSKQLQELWKSITLLCETEYELIL